MTFKELDTQNPVRYIAVRQKTRIKLIPVDQIYYFHANNKYVTIRTETTQFLITEPLKVLEKNQARGFLRIHRNALVSSKYIDMLEKTKDDRWIIGFRNIEDRLRISRRCTPIVRRYLR